MGKIEVEESLILDSQAKRLRSAVISAGKQSAAMLEKNQKRDNLRKISTILRKPAAERTADEIALLESSPSVTKHARKLADRVDQSKQRLLEQEDQLDVCHAKAQQLADWLSCARHLVCYTGAGISTAARIPDYRGSNGIWTRLQKGESIGQHDLSLAEPTFTHMALFELHRHRILQYVLSQNCDGLHLRSGLPRESLSEVHGNMYVEVCTACKPNREYLRRFDCTELTARYCHKTNRRCHICAQPLVDTIVHFGERGSLRWPLNWHGASEHSEKADVILCLGSSLKVLKKYSWLWQMDRPKGKRPKLCIVNLQWTPKDAFADLKVNGKCDAVMELVMKYMGIRVREYTRRRDPLFAHATALLPEERHTVTQPMLESDGDDDDDDEEDGDEDGDADGDENEPNVIAANGDSKPPMEVIKSEIKTEHNVFNQKTMMSEIVPVTSDLKVKIEPHHSQAIKSELSLPTNGSTTSVQIAEHSIKTETNNASNGQASAVILISDSDESQSSASAKTTASCTSTSNSSDAGDPVTQPTARTMLPVAGPSQRPPPPPRPLHVPVPAPPVPFFNTSPLGLRTISPQRKATDPPIAAPPPPPEIQPLSAKTRLPYWYETGYVYSGLHTIIHPTPDDVQLFRTATKSVHQLDAKRAQCAFCFDNYAELKCMFYAPGAGHANVERNRAGRLIVCECCSTKDADDDVNVSIGGMVDNGDGDGGDGCVGGLLLVDDDDDDAEQSGSADTDDAAVAVAAVAGGLQCDDSADAAEVAAKRTKLDDSGGLGTRVQPGWYGKGYRKSRRRRRM